ncbi:MAG: sugar phosphate isomerase/epimerase family protein [Verrucomicrobiota bacterium]
MPTNRYSRRGFLRLSAGGALAGAGLLSSPLAPAIEPIQRKGPPRMALALAAYSFRESFKDNSTRKQAASASGKQIDMFDFVDYCADHACAAEVTSYFFPKDPSDEYLLRLRRHAFLRGVAISGTAVGNNFAHPKGEKRDQEIAAVKRWIDRAAVVGAPHIRIFAGGPPKGTSDAEARQMCIAAIEECCDYAGQKGIFLGLENHGGIVALPEGLLEIVRAVKSPWLGVNLDTGNFHTDDPYGDLAKCAPYAVNVQVKVEIGKTRGDLKPADLSRLVKILRDVNYQGFVALEYEAKEDPWKAVPPLLQQLRQLMA